MVFSYFQCAFAQHSRADFVILLLFLFQIEVATSSFNLMRNPSSGTNFVFPIDFIHCNTFTLKNIKVEFFAFIDLLIKQWQKWCVLDFFGHLIDSKHNLY
jgi:hypothetical protein